MKTTALQWAALCVCPPAVLATSVATVPAVKRVAHEATRGKAPVKLAAKKRSATVLASAKRPPCDVGSALPTSAALASLGDVPAVPGSGSGIGGGDLGGLGGVGSPRVGGGFFGGGLPIGGFVLGGGGIGSGGAGGGGTTVDTPTVVSPIAPIQTVGGAVPEPQTWLMMIAGFGTIGWLMRNVQIDRVPARRAPVNSWQASGKRPSRRRRALTGSKFWRGLTTRPKSKLSALLIGVGTEGAASGTASMATLAAKTLLCVCPTAALVGAAVTVPPVRNSVHAATAFAKPPSIPGAPASSVPCDPTIRSVDGSSPTIEKALSNGPLIRMANASASPTLWAMRDGELTQ